MAPLFGLQIPIEGIEVQAEADFEGIGQAAQVPPIISSFVASFVSSAPGSSFIENGAPLIGHRIFRTFIGLTHHCV